MAALVSISAALCATASASAAIDTKISSGPSGPISSRSATFRFRATVPKAIFQCKIDKRPWAACTSPRKYRALPQGRHTFQARARKGHAVDRTPARRSFAVDTVPPDTTILTGPSGSTNEHAPSFSFKSNEAGTFQCRITSASSPEPFTRCSSPFSPATPLQDAAYSFEVRAVDAAGNADATPATRSFSVTTETPILTGSSTPFPVDTVPPETTILTGPSGYATTASPSFTFESNESGTFQCRISSTSSSPAFAPCSSPFSPATPLDNTAYTFDVRAVDAAGNTDPTPATRSFTVDTVLPETTVFGPQDNLLPYVNGYTEDQTPSSTFESSEPASFECRIISAGSSPSFQPCDTPFVPASPLPRDAFYTIEARAIDAAGNVDPTPATWDFDVETPITEDQQTAEAAAALSFPDAANRDSLAICGGTTTADCPGGTALAPDDNQINVASSRSIVWAGPNSHRYDATITHDSHTLNPVVATFQGSDCNLTWNSANGATAHWTVSESLSFVTQQGGHSVPGGKLIEPTNISMSGVDSADIALGGSVFCTNFTSSYLSAFTSLYPSFVGADRALCAALGPGYIAPCAQ